MINKTLQISSDIILKAFATTDDPDIIYNAEPIREYVIYQKAETLADSFFEWIMEEDLELQTVWVSLLPNYDPTKHFEITVNTVNTTNWTLIIPFSGLTILGSAGFFSLPPACLLRRGWTLLIKTENPIVGIQVIGKNCKINKPINAEVFLPNSFIDQT